MEITIPLVIVAVWFGLLAGGVALLDWRVRRQQRRWFAREIERLDRWRGSA